MQKLNIFLVISRSKLWELLKSITHANQNRIVLFSTHDMQEAEVLSDLVAVIARGENKAFSTPSELITRNSAFFHLHVVKADNFDKAAVEKCITVIVDGVVDTLKETENSVVFVVPKQTSSEKSVDVAAVLSALVDNKEAFGIDNLDLDIESLEQVFLDITEKSYVEEELDKFVKLRGKAALVDCIKYLNEKANSLGWDKVTEKDLPKKVTAMKRWAVLTFSINSAFVSNGGVYFGTIIFVITLVMWANLFSNGISASWSSLDYFGFPLIDKRSTARGSNVVLPDQTFTNTAQMNTIATSLFGNTSNELNSISA
ncbi:hypothetical protein HK096_000251, partial [Nowakowskiella sp. JEL0078]